MLTQGKAIEVLYNALPLSVSIRDIDLDINKDYIYFKWSENKYRFSLKSRIIEVSEGHILSSTDTALLMTRLINKYLE